MSTKQHKKKEPLVGSNCGMIGHLLCIHWNMTCTCRVCQQRSVHVIVRYRYMTTREIVAFDIHTLVVISIIITILRLLRTNKISVRCQHGTVYGIHAQ
jgi:hypothetical protein